MIKSMTAFAHSEANYDFGVLGWEIRSVNHRYLDVNTRLPEDFRNLEQLIRERVSKKIKRGKVDCILRYRPELVSSADIEIEKVYMQAVINACSDINTLLPNPAPIRAIDILRWPGVIKEPKKDLTPVQETTLSMLDNTIDQLVMSREREGVQIAKILNQRCDSMNEIIQKVRERNPEILRNIRTKIDNKLHEMQVNIDKDRIEQEMVILAQRMDIDEELDRLNVHLAEVEAVLTKQSVAGRRLDFLMQELNREANTLGSKSGDSATTQAAVDLKVLIEQMREQIQNIE